MKIVSRFCSIVLGGLALILLAAAFRSEAICTDGSSQPLPKVQLSGENARAYLERSKDGQSLMQALTAARFGLQWQEHAPGESKREGGGYLGLSHEQNLNAWFDEEGMTVRPTLPEEKRDQGWSMALRLQAYGYGKQLSAVPPIVSRKAKGHRIEYLRQGSASFQLATPLRRKLEACATLIEWYENKAEGIEQGFTLNERPTRCSDGALSPFQGWESTPTERGDYSARIPEIVSEPLRLVLAVEGDLRARTGEGGTIELVETNGKGTLSYSNLVAQDTDGKRLAARMEASADGREIALIVEDAGARYPIVIDPIVASLEKKLDASPDVQAEARFGAAVAIDGDRAVVGAWRHDSGFPLGADKGAVCIFTRSGTAPNFTWTRSNFLTGANAGDGCGQSVAISGNRIVYGCPGANNNTGKAYVFDLSTGKELIPPSGFVNAGDRYGASVAISGNTVAVGAPLNYNGGWSNNGEVFIYTLNPDLSYGRPPALQDFFNGTSNNQFGASVALDGTNLLVGIPGAGGGAGKAAIFFNGATAVSAYLFANDGAAGNQFGSSVALSGNTAVIGAPLNSNAKGTNAGAAYVFVRDTNGNWSQQQKLTASDGKANAYFSASAVAIQGNTIVVGSYAWSPFNQLDFGKAYVFMRSTTVWTQQATMVGDNQAGDQFGIGVGISGDTVIAGARTATASGVASAGAAYVYRLDCVPPISVEFDPTNETVCLGGLVQLVPSQTFVSGHRPTSYQWRKNGVNIGAPSDMLPYTINAATAADAGSYDVIASTACGSVTSNTLTLTVHTFTLNPTSQNFGVSGSTGIVNVTATGASCNWTAVSNASFITVNSGSSGTGNGTVGFTVAANPNSGQRTGTITIAGKTFTVTQDGTNCSYSIAPTSITLGASASTNVVNVTAGPGCAWTATSNDPAFLSINSGASGSGNGTVTYTIAANSTTAQRTGTLTIAGQTFTVTQAAAQPTVLANISTRLRVETGDNALIGGIIVTGSQNKKIIVRAIGPSLGFADKLADPILELRDGSGAVLEANDNWMDSPNKQAIIDSTIPPNNPLESAIVRSVPPGNYTAIERGVNNGTGIGVVEAYDLDTAANSKLANISTRGLVQTGDNVLFAGMIVVGQASQKVIVRALGPSTGVPGALADPTLELRDQNGGLLEANDNWMDSPNKQAIIDSTIPPNNPLESAIVRTLAPANYTAIVRGVNNTTGIAVVEVYALQ